MVSRLTTPDPAAAQVNQRAILLMILSMGLLALTDMFAKLALQTIPYGEVMFVVSVGGTILFMAMARWQRAPLVMPEFRHPAVIWRNIFEVIAGVSITIAIARIPLPTFAAVMQFSPLVVTLGAAVLLKEAVGWRRWTAVFIGIVGMLIILRPGTAGFSPDVLWAVVAVSALAFRDLTTRLAPPNVSSITLSTWGFGATVPVALVLMLTTGDGIKLDTMGLIYSGAAVISTTFGYYAITSAMRMAPASVVAPFRYARLIFTTGLAIAVFGQWPDGMTLLGAAIIMASGLYSFARERRLAQKAA